MDNFIKYFEDLYQNRKIYTLLQWLYLAIAIISVLICGVIALLNQSLGVGLLIVPAISSIAFCTNLVAWSLLSTLLENVFSKKTTKKKSK